MMYGIHLWADTTISAWAAAGKHARRSYTRNGDGDGEGYWLQWADERFGDPPLQSGSRSLQCRVGR